MRPVRQREDEIERIHGVILVSLPAAVVDPQVPPEHAVKNRRTIAVHRVEESLANGPCRGDSAVQFETW